ncbi:MAG: response regulator [Candidatus Paceibacterota bacterium]|jgi:DNA-binding response OmpR family regulator
MYKILIVEDNEAIRKSIAGELSLENFSVTESADGEDALKKIVTEKPDLIILDIILPKLSGLDVLKKVRNDPKTKSIKVIIFTNLDADEKMLAQISELKPNFYINKGNLHLQDLPEKIRECIES